MAEMKENGTGAAHDETAPRRTDPSVMTLANAMLRHRYVVGGLCLGAIVLVLTLAILSPRTYSSGASFLPQTQTTRSSIASGLAAQFGLSLDAQPGNSPQFYAELIRSREILGQLATVRYTAVDAEEEQGLSGTIADLYEIESESPARRREEALRRLDEAIGVATQPQTGIVEVSVSTPWPGVSQDIAVRLLELLNEFDLEKRQSQATAERLFVEERLAEMRSGLMAAEGELQHFLQQNRRFENSPELRFEHDRLQRTVAMRQQLVTSLAQAYEQARMDEVRNTPVITILDAPAVPVRPDSRGLLFKLITAVIVSLVVGLVLSLLMDSFAGRGRKNAPEVDEFRALRREMRADVGRIRSIFGRERGIPRETSDAG